MTNAFKGAALSFYSGAYYGELAREHKGIGAGLVLVLTLLTTIFLFVALLAGNQFADLRELLKSLPEKSQMLPAVDFHDGKLSIDKPVPYKINLGTAPDEGFIIIDTNYAVSDLATLEKFMRDQKVVVLITADKVISRDMKQAEGQNTFNNPLEIHELKDMKPFLITHEKWHAMAETLYHWGVSLLTFTGFFMVTLALFIGNLLATLLTALVVMVLGLIFKEGLEFSAACRLAAAARIPVTVLSSLPVFMGFVPLRGFAAWGIWMIYLVFAVMAVRLHGGKRLQ